MTREVMMGRGRAGYIAAIAIASIAATGCATMSPEDRTAKQAEIQRTVPTCASAKECEVKWAAARQWILTNAGYKFQTMTNDFMETYNASSDSVEVSARAQKVPVADGSYRIEGGVACANTYGCRLSPLDALIHFNKYVTGSWTAP